MRLPDGPWFPWSREFRWDLMPWNRSRAVDDVHDRRQLVVLAEAAGATIGPLARAAGFVLNAGACGIGFSDPGGRNLTVLYEAAPDEFRARFPDHSVMLDDVCVDLWVYWYPEPGVVDVSLKTFSGPRGLEGIGRDDLVEVVTRKAQDSETLRDILATYREGLATWLGIDTDETHLSDQ